MTPQSGPQTDRRPPIAYDWETSTDHECAVGVCLDPALALRRLTTAMREIGSREGTVKMRPVFDIGCRTMPYAVVEIGEDGRDIVRMARYGELSLHG